MRRWDANTGQQIGAPLTGHTDFVDSVAFSPDGRRVCLRQLGQDHTAVERGNGPTHRRAATGDTDWVNSVAFSPDGKRIVSGSADKTVRVWHADTGQQIGPPLTNLPTSAI